jgi:hypothetical protein
VINLAGFVSDVPRHFGAPAWIVEAVGSPVPCGPECKPRERFWAPDSALRPIRDPGDDARDEMLRPLPADLGVLA